MTTIDDGSADQGAAAPRRVIVGPDETGRSTVVSEGSALARTVRPNGSVVQEIWRQERLPARADDNGTRTGEMEQMPPEAGVSIRMFTIPPDRRAGTAVELAAPAALAERGRSEPSASIPKMRRTDSLYVATVISGEAYVVLETGDVLLRAGDSLVLPGSMHAWRNVTDSPATLITTVFHLAHDAPVL